MRNWCGWPSYPSWSHDPGEGFFLNAPVRKENSAKRNWGFAKNSNFLIPTVLQPDDVNLWYFKLGLFNLTYLEDKTIFNKSGHVRA